MEPNKKTNVSKRVLVGLRPSRAVHAVRLSDPGLADEVQRLSERLQSDPKYAMKLLRKAGIATAAGKLSERYGG